MVQDIWVWATADSLRKNIHIGCLHSSVLPDHVSRCCPKSELLSPKSTGLQSELSGLSLQQCGCCYVHCYFGEPGNLGKQQMTNLDFALGALKAIFCVIWKLWVYGFVSEEGQVIEITRKKSECIELICLTHISTLSQLSFISMFLAHGYMFEHETILENPLLKNSLSPNLKAQVKHQPRVSLTSTVITSI